MTGLGTRGRPGGGDGDGGVGGGGSGGMGTGAGLCGRVSILTWPSGRQGRAGSCSPLLTTSRAPWVLRITQGRV